MKIKKLLFLLVITCGVIIGPNVFAASVSGYNTYYIQQTSNGTLPDNYSSTVSGLAFPTTTYTQIPAYQNQTYNVIRAMDLQFPSVEFTVGSTYTFTINFDYGSYIYPNWPNNQAHPFSVRSCPHGTCSITYTWQNDSTHQSVNTLQLKLVHKANANQTGKTFGIGPMTTNTGLFYNAYSSQQGIRINSATVDIVEDPNYQNTQDIINNQNQNTQTIINNQNENTEKEIESQRVCKTTTYNYNYADRSSYNSNYLSDTNGTLLSGANQWFTSDFIPVSKNKTYSISIYANTGAAYTCYYDTNQNLTSCVLSSTILSPFPASKTFTSDFDGYIRTSFRLSSNNDYAKIVTNVCVNGNQALNDTLTDDNLPDVINSGGGGGTYFDDINQSSQTPISDLLLLPLNLLNAINNSINNQCTPYTIPFDFTGGNNTLTFPCLNLEQYLGSNLWGVIDAMFCIFMFYNIAMLIIRFFEDWTSARDTFDILFKPEGGGF